jgi:transposase
MSRLPKNIVAKIIELRKRKMSISEIVRRLEVSKPTVIKYCMEAGISNKNNKHERLLKLYSDVQSTPCSSFLRQKAKSLDEGRRLLEKNFDVTVCKQTVRRCLLRNKVKCYIKTKKPLLSERHKGNRLKFVENFSHYDYLGWKAVIWSDECKFALLNTNNREFYWKRRSDPIQDCHIKKTLKFGGGSIMTWGCITSEGVGKLIRIDGIMTAEKYIKILEEGLLGTLEDYQLPIASSLFMHDNDPKHTAKCTKEWLRVNKIKVMDWPAESPDINPIENLWSIVDQRLRKRETKPKNVGLSQLSSPRGG